MISQAVVVTTMMILLDTGRCWEPKLMPTCPARCGNPAIPFPFGISSDCNLNSSFCITCNYSYDPPKPFLNWESTQVLGTSLSSDLNFSKINISISKNPVPDVLDWCSANLSCRQVQKSVDSSSGAGYHCKCWRGFAVTPYLADEIVLKPYNTSFRAEYTYSTLGDDGKKDGPDHSLQYQTFHSLLFCIYFVFVVPAVAISWIIWWSKQKKVVKLRRDLFIRNGGEILEAKKSVQNTFSVFTAEDLKKATNNYDESNVLFHEHTYKGILPGANCGVTIQFCHAFDGCKIEILISKLVALSQICHGNVVKLLGCCLETQVPLAVFEFITCSKTLLEYINDVGLARSLPWDIRLRIAADTARALAYLHSATIIHGSLNSSNILLGHGYSVKVKGFSLTCLECSCVQLYGDTSIYLDPNFFSSGQLTEKSDTYSFGFILVELLTGKGVMSPEWLEGEENIARFFVGSSRGGDLLRILDDRVVADDNLGQMTQVAEIAKRCLSNSSQERPTMKEVAVKLGILESLEP